MIDTHKNTWYSIRKKSLIVRKEKQKNVMRDNAVGEKLRKLRGNKTQKEVANALKILESSYSMYETGDRNPRDEVKKRISEYYGVSVEEIFFKN